MFRFHSSMKFIFQCMFQTHNLCRTGLILLSAPAVAGVPGKQAPRYSDLVVAEYLVHKHCSDEDRRPAAIEMLAALWFSPHIRAI